MLLTRHDGAIKPFLPTALPTTGHRTFGLRSPKMLDFLPLGFRGAAMIVLGLAQPAEFMRRSHVAGSIRPSELQGADVFDDPTITNTINRLLTQNADAACALPNREPLARRELAPLRRSHIA